MASTPQIYGLNGATTYLGATGDLPGATTMSAGVLFNPAALTTPTTLFDNGNGTTGWKIGYSVSGSTVGIINLVITVNAVVATVAVGAVLDEWMLVSFTLNGTALVVYANGQIAHTATVVAVAPRTGARPTLTTTVNGAVSLAFYTEATLTAANIATIFGSVKYIGGCLPATYIASLALAHVYSAVESQRLPSVTFEDIGSTGGVDLTASAAASGVILPGDFGQAAGVTGATA